MLRKILSVIVLMSLIYTASAQENKTNSSEKNQIIEAVIAEKGFYDAVEVEKRTRINELTQFPNMMLGKTVTDGGCDLFPCPNPMSLGEPASDNGPTIAAIKGTFFSKGVYKSNISLKVNNDNIISYENGLNSPLNSRFSNYQIFVTHESDGATSKLGSGPGVPSPHHGRYEIYSITADRMSDGDLSAREFIKVKTPVSGRYLFSIRAYYGDSAAVSYSPWSELKSVIIEKSDLKVSDLNSITLNACLSNNGYAGDQLIASIDYLDCSDHNLADADMDIIVSEFTGVRYLNLRYNPGNL